MKNQELYDGITGIRDDIIDEAADHRFKKKTMSWRKWCAIAAAFVVVVGLGATGLRLIGAFGFGANAGGGGGSGLSYMSYMGPVFPLTVLGDGGAVEAERSLNFDFSPYETVTEYYTDNDETRSYQSYDAEALVTDGYTLKNTTDEAVTLTAAYPVSARLNAPISQLPVMTVNGERTETKLHIGPYTGGFEGAWGGGGTSLNLAELDSWEKYKTLIEAGYMASAFDELPVLEQPVTVYELSDRAAPEGTDAANPTLNMEFYIDFDRTTILTYGFNGGTNDVEAGYCSRNTHVPESFNPDYGESVYLIVLGDDIGDYTLQGYVDGGCDRGDELDGVTAVVTRYETTLGAMLEKVANQLFRQIEKMEPDENGGSILSTVSDEMLLGLAAELMCDHGLLAENSAERYDFGMLEIILSETRSINRIMYLTFEVTVPAGGSVDVSASMIKKASIDFMGKNKDRNGYDMVTGLGSNLSFTAQSASVSNTEHIEFIDQNFGFDPASGVTEVKLDMAVEHYWMEVRKLK